MTGMKTLIALRKGGMKPSAVTVDLVHTVGQLDAEQFAFAEASGMVHLHIADAESLNDIDFRPLIGLQVFVHDNTGNAPRHRRLCSLIAKAEAAQMVMPVWAADALTVHQRWAGSPARNERFEA